MSEVTKPTIREVRALRRAVLKDIRRGIASNVRTYKNVYEHGRGMAVWDRWQGRWVTREVTEIRRRLLAAVSEIEHNLRDTRVRLPVRKEK